MKLVVLAAILVLTGGCDVDCRDGGALETSYNDGQHAGAAANAAELDRGHAEGLALTREDGARDGNSDGYRRQRL